jgi:hypothetical protein
MLRVLSITSILIIAAAIIVGCERTKSPQAAPPSANALPAGLVLQTQPADAKPVLDIRKSAKEGDPVVMTGVVGGRKDPIAQNRAIFTLIDPSLPTCDKNNGTMKMEHCETPWDACCSPADEIASHSATVQVVDPAGKPLKTRLAGVAGLAPLKRVSVVGKFHTSPDGKLASVDATGIYVAN